MLSACLVTARPRPTPTPLPARPARATAAAATRPTSRGRALRPGRRHSPPTPDQAVSGPTSTSTCPGQSGADPRPSPTRLCNTRRPHCGFHCPTSAADAADPLPRPTDDLSESDDGASSVVGGVPEPAPRGAHGRARGDVHGQRAGGLRARPREEAFSSLLAVLGAASHARQATGLGQHACMQADVMTLSIEQYPALEESLEAQSCSLSHDSGRVVASEHNGLDTFKTDLTRPVAEHSQGFDSDSAAASPGGDPVADLHHSVGKVGAHQGAGAQ